LRDSERLRFAKAHERRAEQKRLRLLSTLVEAHTETVSHKADPHELLALQLRRENREKTAQKDKADADRKRKAEEEKAKSEEAQFQLERKRERELVAEVMKKADKPFRIQDIGDRLAMLKKKLENKEEEHQKKTEGTKFVRKKKK
jgi:hypothetical protein